MLWAALLPTPSPPSIDDSLRTVADAVQALATWCLQYTPRVSVVEPSALDAAVVMELEASVRLFGGKRRLVERIKAEAGELGVAQLSWAPTSLAAVAFARAGQSNGFRQPLVQLLDTLPLQTLSPVRLHEATLVRIGCKTLGDVRSLPRGGMTRRFDAQLLATLDQAYGLRPEAHEWVTLPDTFHARLELQARVELAAALLFGARRLLMQMCGWLAAKHAGITSFRLKWAHDFFRSRDAGEGGEMTVRTAAPMRDVEHLTRLLAEQLGKVRLAAPVGELELLALDVVPLEEKSGGLIPEPRQEAESLALVLERIAARLGPQRVLRPVLKEDHRPEWMAHWQPAPEAYPNEATPPKAGRRRKVRCVDIPQPTFVLPEPLKLATRDNRPLYQGELQPLLGPHRVEGGWWDRTAVDGVACTRHVNRDYYVALSEHAGVLWIFQTRLAGEDTAWYLHGTFA